MKIVIITPYFYPKIGGLENYILNISKGLKEKGNNVVIITSNHLEKKYIVENIEGLKVYRLPITFTISNTPINFNWIFKIINIIDIEKPNIINGHTPVPFINDISVIIAKLKKIRYVTTYHAAGLRKNQLFLDLVTLLYSLTIEKLALKLSDYIIITNDYVEKLYLRNYNHKIYTITPGVNTSIFFPDKAKLKKSNSKSIIFIANLNKSNTWKGLLYLLDAFSIASKRITNLKLNIIGDGNLILYYKKKANAFPNKNDITFLGEKNTKEIANKLRENQLLVLPSYSNAESFGMVLIEAMACKKPVIGTNIGGIPNIVSNKINGLIVPPKNSVLLAKAIMEIFENPDTALKYGENGFKLVNKKYTWSLSINKTNELFKYLIQI